MKLQITHLRKKKWHRRSLNSVKLNQLNLQNLRASLQGISSLLKKREMRKTGRSERGRLY